ncbi:hypothetical protein GGI12_005278, partial [Dipsacomyces acuminosporus]
LKATSRTLPGNMQLNLNMSNLHRTPQSAPHTANLLLSIPATNLLKDSEPQTPLTATNGARGFRHLPIAPLSINGGSERQKSVSMSMAPQSLDNNNGHSSEEGDDDFGMAKRANHVYKDGPKLILPNLYLGGENNVDDEQLQRLNIKYILNVAREVSRPQQQQQQQQQHGGDSLNMINITPDYVVSYRHYKWDHNEPDLQRCFASCFEFIDEARSKNQPILVHCQLGVSRSASLVIAYVMKTRDLGFSAAYDFVRSIASCISPNLSLIAQLCEYGRILNEAKHASAASVPSTASSTATLLGNHRQCLLNIDVDDAQSIPELSLSVSSSENSSPVDAVGAPPPLQHLAPSPQLPLLTIKPTTTSNLKLLQMPPPPPPTIIPQNPRF